MTGLSYTNKEKYNMATAKVIFGSTTGMTEAVAGQIASALGCEAVNIASADAAAFDADVLVLGTSTWGVGDLQDDWMAQLDNVKANFAGKKVVVFGLGDSVGFADSFCTGAETIANAAKEAGATLLADVVKIDDTNESAETPAKVEAIVAAVKAA